MVRVGAHGAALVVATDELSRPGAEFGPALGGESGSRASRACRRSWRWSRSDAPTVRVLIFGGEACPTELAHRWLKPGRGVFNTYGPTEATVIATAAALAPGRPVTIGKPIEGTGPCPPAVTGYRMTPSACSTSRPAGEARSCGPHRDAILSASAWND